MTGPRPLTAGRTKANLIPALVSSALCAGILLLGPGPAAASIPQQASSKLRSCRDVAIIQNSGFYVGDIRVRGISCRVTRRALKLYLQERGPTLVELGFTVRNLGNPGGYCGGDRYRAVRGAQVIAFTISAC